jgi:hypothetical protein
MVHIPLGRISCMMRTRWRLFKANVGYICSATIRRPRRPLIRSYWAAKSSHIHYPTCMTNDTEWIGPVIVWRHSPHLNTSKGGCRHRRGEAGRQASASFIISLIGQCPRQCTAYNVCPCTVAVCIGQCPRQCTAYNVCPCTVAVLHTDVDQGYTLMLTKWV